ncbi:amidohydrolase family protein, partial [Streptomyces sp. NPDC059761]|uniref:amidohydrolase family protein n=1 Tax=Streptomyces sp. NPDC059761 TaxID=3346937 RepID=UPI0036607537
MTTTLVTNIGSLVTNDPALGDGSPLGLIENAAVVIDGETIAWVGPAGQAPAADSAFDANGRALIPGFVDSHSHLVFAGDRTAEFNARMSGRSYSAGGIRTTVAATRAATDAGSRKMPPPMMLPITRQGAVPRPKRRVCRSF